MTFISVSLLYCLVHTCRLLHTSGILTDLLKAFSVITPLERTPNQVQPILDTSLCYTQCRHQGAAGFPKTSISSSPTAGEPWHLRHPPGQPRRRAGQRGQASWQLTAHRSRAPLPPSPVLLLPRSAPDRNIKQRHCPAVGWKHWVSRQAELTASAAALISWVRTG